MSTLARSDAAAAYAPPTSAPIVRIAGLTKAFTKRRGLREMLRSPRTRERATAVDGVSCEIAPGEFFGLLGPNGAGKTTLFKMLATVLLPDAGTATIDGHDVVRHAADVRRVLTPAVGDERSLQWRLSARENLELFAVLLEVPRREQRARIDELLVEVGLADTGAKLVGAFSSGMRQRLLIARALLARPKVLLLDEPTRSLDPISARAFRTFLREEIAGRRNCAILLATHNAEEAFDLCDRVAVLDRGRLLACGPAHALAAEYGDERYVVWTTSPGHAAFPELVARGLADEAREVEGGEGGWRCVQLSTRLNGQRDVAAASRAASVLQFLTAAGVPIARFERAPLPLADLLERVVSRGRAPEGVKRNA
jgi:ABC-2 type transport system ATP-binding protein